MQVKSNGIELEVEIVGTGEPLVLIMGIGCQLVYWPDGLVDELVRRGFQVIRFDNRDMGLSTWLDHLRAPSVGKALVTRVLGQELASAPYTLSDMAADTQGLIHALGLSSAHVFGVSMGGMIAQTMAIETPGCMRTMTSMMATTGDRRYLPSPDALRLLLGPAPKNRDEAKKRLIALMEGFAGPDHPIDRELTGAIADRAWERIGGRHHASGFLRQFVAVLASGSRRNALKSVRVPSLVLHGKDDPLIPLAGGKAVARAIPHARFRAIPGLGHTLSPSVWPIIAEELRHHAGLPYTTI